MSNSANRVFLDSNSLLLSVEDHDVDMFDDFLSPLISSKSKWEDPQVAEAAAAATAAQPAAKGWF